VLPSDERLRSELELARQECELFQKLLDATYHNSRIEDILDILADGVQTILKFKTVLISLFDEKAQVFERQAQAGIPASVFQQLKKQKVPHKRIKILLRPEFRVGNSYFVPHTNFEKSKKLREYIEKYGRKIHTNARKKRGTWHPDDVFLTPIKTSDGKFLGIVSVDNPMDREFPSEKTISVMETFSTYASIAIESIRRLRSEKEASRRMNAIHNISKIIGKIFDLNTLYRETIHIIRDRFGYSNIAIFEVNAKGIPVLKSFSGYSDVDIRKVTKNLASKGLTAVVLRTRKSLLIPNVQREPDYIGESTHPKSEVIIPLIIKDRTVGILDVETLGENSLGEEDLYNLSLLGEYIAMSIDNAHLYRETQRLAIRDEMTGTFNYRYFRDVLKKMIREREKTKEPLSLLMVDIDNFKQMNDTFGHIEGDRVLKKVSRVIKENVRRMDVVTRYGGDEFVIILWGVDKDDARLLGERIRKAVKTELGMFESPLTLSIGVAAYPKDGKKVGVLLDKVDKALYRAKSKGRDCISA
jgi:diguanylate cyclase (GGDEF)-like protein